MSREIQSRTGLALVMLLVLCGVSGVSATVVIEPILDASGAGVYVVEMEGALAGATSTIDVLLSNAELEENPLLPALVDASARGVRVRVLLDQSDWSADITEDNLPTIAWLNENGVEARFDDPTVTTHAKLVIIDDRITILGSTNWNRYALTTHVQANVRIDDERIAGTFSEYFQRLWTDRLVAGGVRLESTVTAGDKPTIIALPDTDDTALYGHVLLDLLRRAEASIHVVMYRMSTYSGYADSLSNGIADALVSAVRRGVDVRVLLDDCSYYEDSARANLASAIVLYQGGVNVRFDEPGETTHAKLVIVDGESVLIGSTNWNYYALERNVEASVALLRMPDVAEMFEAFFAELWAASRSTAGGEAE